MTNQYSDKINRYRPWIVLAVIYFCFLISAIIFQSIPPILNLILNDLNFSHAQGGLLMSFFALPGIVISIPAGMLADRYGQKLIGIASLLFMSAGGTIFALGHSIQILTLGRTISGIGAMILLVISPQMVSQWFSSRQLGIAMGLFTTGMPVGVIISMNLLSFLGEWMGWRATMWITVGFPILALPFFYFLYSSIPDGRISKQPLVNNPFKGILQVGLPLCLVGIAWMFFNAAFISLFTFTPDFLKSNGYGIAFSGFLTGLVMLPQLPLNPLVGYTMEKVGGKPLIIAIGGISLAILVGIIPLSLNWIATIMVLIGILTSLIPPPIYALPADIVDHDSLGLSYGILSTCQNLGVLFGPFAVGMMIDFNNSYQKGYILMTLFAAMVVMSMIIFIRISKRSSTQIATN